MLRPVREIVQRTIYSLPRLILRPLARSFNLFIQPLSFFVNNYIHSIINNTLFYLRPLSLRINTCVSIAEAWRIRGAVGQPWASVGGSAVWPHRVEWWCELNHSDPVWKNSPCHNPGNASEVMIHNISLICVYTRTHTHTHTHTCTSTHAHTHAHTHTHTQTNKQINTQTITNALTCNALAPTRLRLARRRRQCTG